MVVSYDFPSVRQKCGGAFLKAKCRLQEVFPLPQARLMGQLHGPPGILMRRPSTERSRQHEDTQHPPDMSAAREFVDLFMYGLQCSARVYDAGTHVAAQCNLFRG